MTYPFLNFRVGVGQWGFRIKEMRWEKSAPSNLFRIAEILVDRILDQGRTKGGFGVKLSLELDILQKLCYLRKGD